MSSAYSIQGWMEDCPQGYLLGTKFGHEPDEGEPALILENEVLREESVRTTVQLLVGERCALAASSGLINATPDEASKRFLATQTLDEARHVEMFTQRLYDLGVEAGQLDDAVNQYAHPNLLEFSEVLLDKVHEGDFVAAIVGQNIILEGMALTAYGMLCALLRDINPRFVRMLSGAMADEKRHVGFGETTIGELVRRHPEKTTEIEKMQHDLSYHMLRTFAEAFRDNPVPAELRRVAKAAGAAQPHAIWQGADLALLEGEEMEAVLAKATVAEFEARLGRVGLDYRSPGSL